MIQAAAYTDARGIYVDADEVAEHDGAFWHGDEPVNREFGKMGKSLQELGHARRDVRELRGRHAAAVRDVHGARSTRAGPWDTKAVVGVYRLLQRIWRNVIDEDTGEVTVTDDDPDDETLRVLHRTIDAVRDGMEKLRFNVSIAKITELNNHLTARTPTAACPASVAEPLVLLLAPLAPHVAEELWSRWATRTRWPPSRSPRPTRH